MSLEKNFCSSPWFHMRINNAGNYEYCRWADKAGRLDTDNISTTTPQKFFQQGMAPIRQAMLNGEVVPGCHACERMEQHHKVSGRQKQLLKTGIYTHRLAKTMKGSPWLEEFAHSETSLMPQDWQIDLGNYCNSACVFCSPVSSSRLATEWQRIGFIDQLPPRAWCDDPEQLASFVDTLVKSPHIQYLHFIGGETMITPAFRKILQALIAAGLNRTATIGFTTNLTTWDDSIVELLAQFKSVNLGMSIECFHPVNDYVRWPSEISQVQKIAEQWVAVARQHDWLLQMRTTPTILTIGQLTTVYDFAWKHNIAVESCDFLNEPAHMRISVLPAQYRKSIADHMGTWLKAHQAPNDQVLNIRDPGQARAQMTQDLSSYRSYLAYAQDESHLLPDLAKFLHTLEAGRGNKVLDYVPEYKELLQSAGY